MNNNPNIPPNIEGLATLLVLQDQIKELSNLKEYGFFVTNETHRLIHYHTAYLWQRGKISNVKLLAQSEVAEIEVQSPLNQWVAEFINTMLNLNNSKENLVLNFSILSEEVEEAKKKLDKAIIKNWPEALPNCLLWSPFLDPMTKGENKILGGLILFREQAFSEQESKMFKWLANNYQYTWLVLTKSKMLTLSHLIKNNARFKIICSIIILFIMFFPTRMSVAAKATVTSKDPALINAPIPGIIKEFLVKPGDKVKTGQLLVVLDKTDLIKSVEVSQKKVDLVQAKLRSANMQSYANAETQADIPILEAELAVNQAELDFTKSILSKADIVSPTDGIAVFESKEDWTGQPIQAGENLMSIENPDKLQLKISLPIHDLIDLKTGSKGKFYVYGKLSEIPVVLTSLEYNAKTNPNKILAYEYTADFTDPTITLGIGNQGIVHLYGNYVPFVYFLLRRPLQTFRQSFGI